MAVASSAGTVLRRGGGGSPETFTAIPGATSFRLQQTTTMIDATSLDDTWKEKVPGTIDPGSLTFSLLWDPTHATHIGLAADFAARTLRNFQIYLPQHTKTYSFSGYVSAWQPGGAVDEILTQEVTIDITGEVVVT